VRLIYSVPKIDFNLWTSNGQSYARKACHRISKYLVFPYVEDDFIGHDERRE
jgi:hypothetical protein